MTAETRTPNTDGTFPVINEAIALIEKFAETLDTSRAPCEACHCTVYNNYTEYQLQVELVGMMNKLRAIPRRLAGKKGKNK